MKRKKFLILGSIFAGVALVGGTFAAWAITDNAAQKSLKISPETIQTDTNTKYVTLEWGQSTTELTDVANLEANTTRYAGAVKLKASYTGSTSYKGLLKASLTQSTYDSVHPTQNLIKYLEVTAYTSAITYDSKTKKIATLPDAEDRVLDLVGNSSDVDAGALKVSGQQSIAMLNDTPVDVYFAVNLSSDATAVFDNIKNDVVTLTVDWDHDPTGQEVTNGVTVYYNPGSLSEGEKVFCYAWKGKVANAGFPGAEMHNEGNGIYSYVISTDSTNGFENFILSHGTISPTGEANVTKFVETSSSHDEFTVASVVETGENPNNYFADGARGKKPEADPSLHGDYYLVGNMAASNWGCNETYVMTKDSTVKDDQNQDTYKIENVSLAAGQLIKVRNNTNYGTNEWYNNVSTWTGCGYNIDDAGNLVIIEAGTYTVRLYKNSTYNNHVIIDRTGD